VSRHEDLALKRVFFLLNVVPKLSKAPDGWLISWGIRFELDQPQGVSPGSLHS